MSICTYWIIQMAVTLIGPLAILTYILLGDKQ